jgi:pimeloyl-ACP methyl ester carboxylesterase
LYFEADGETLFGVLTRPTGASNGVGILLLSSGLATASPGRNRVYTRFGRQLAANGFTSLRFDYRGTGESTGLMEKFRLADPVVPDAVGAAQVLADDGITDVISIGVCYGARTALASAEHIDTLRGMVLLAPPMRDFEIGEQFTSKPLSWWVRKGARWQSVRGLFSRHRRGVYSKLLQRKFRRRAARSESPADREARRFLSPRVVNQLTDAIERGQRVLLLFGEDDACYAEFQQLQQRRLRQVLERAGDLVSVAVVPGKVHGLTTSAVQRDVISATVEWLPSVVQTLSVNPTR